jgi:hypothetical protein
MFVECMLHAIPDGAYFLILRLPELCRLSRLLSNRKISCSFNALRHDTARHKVTFMVTPVLVIGKKWAGSARPSAIPGRPRRRRLRLTQATARWRWTGGGSWNYQCRRKP